MFVKTICGVSEQLRKGIFWESERIFLRGGRICNFKTAQKLANVTSLAIIFLCNCWPFFRCKIVSRWYMNVWKQCVRRILGRFRGSRSQTFCHQVYSLHKLNTYHITGNSNQSWISIRCLEMHFCIEKKRWIPYWKRWSLKVEYMYLQQNVFWCWCII